MFPSFLIGLEVPLKKNRCKDKGGKQEKKKKRKQEHVFNIGSDVSSRRKRNQVLLCLQSVGGAGRVLYKPTQQLQKISHNYK